MTHIIEFIISFVIWTTLLGFISWLAYLIGKISAKRELAKYKQALEDSIKREEIARKVIEDKNKKYRK